MWPYGDSGRGDDIWGGCRTGRGLSFTSDVRRLFLSVVTQKYLNYRHPTFHPITIPTLCSQPDPTYTPLPMAASGRPARDFSPSLRFYSARRDNRFAFSSDGSETITENTSINIENLSELIPRINAFFDGVCMQMDVIEENIDGNRGEP